MATKNKSLGFTIAELAVVIVVIAILALLTTVGYGQYREHTKATVISTNLTLIADAFKLTAMHEDMTVWWSDDEYVDESGESTLAYLIENTVVGSYISEVPKLDGEDDSFWMYDNDGDEGEEFYDPISCPLEDLTYGVNIQIELRDNASLAQSIDKMIDDGDLECGTFRQHPDNPGEFVYLISQSSKVSDTWRQR